MISIGFMTHCHPYLPGLAWIYPPGFYPSGFIRINPPNFFHLHPEKIKNKGKMLFGGNPSQSIRMAKKDPIDFGNKNDEKYFQKMN